jgi:hypothetical protein
MDKQSIRSLVDIYIQSYVDEHRISAVDSTWFLWGRRRTLVDAGKKCYYMYGVLRWRTHNPFFGRHVYEVLIRGRDKQSNLKIPKPQTVRNFQNDIVLNSIFFSALSRNILIRNYCVAPFPYGHAVSVSNRACVRQRPIFHAAPKNDRMSRKV